MTLLDRLKALLGGRSTERSSETADAGVHATQDPGPMPASASGPLESEPTPLLGDENRDRDEREPGSG